jgi:DNA polymerase epsilon subunit 1
MLLDASVSTEVLGLRRALLAQVKVREFSSESDFTDPCLSFVLRDVFCTYCGLCRDLDLLRDLGVTGPEDTRWQCVQCHNVLNRVDIENRLVEEAERLSLSYMLQDLYCPQTRRASRRLCTSRSEMSAPLVMNTTQQLLQSKIDIFIRIAQFYKFDFLQSILDDLMGTKGASNSAAELSKS